MSFMLDEIKICCIFGITKCNLFFSSMVQLFFPGINAQVFVYRDDQGIHYGEEMKDKVFGVFVFQKYFKF